jgi:hypothetical protein
MFPRPRRFFFDRIRRRGVENPPIRRADLDRSIAIFQAPTPEEMALFDPPLHTRSYALRPIRY